LTVWYFFIDLESKKIGKYLDSNLFQSIITFSVGMLWFLAYYIYKEQQKERKEDIAKAMIFEIREAEKNITVFRNLWELTTANKWIIYSKIKILTTNNWTCNVNLFIDILDEDDIHLMNSFYENCEKLNRELLNLQNIKNTGFIEKAKRIQWVKMDLLKDIFNKGDEFKEPEKLKIKYYEESKKVTDILHDEEYWYESYTPMKDFIQVIMITKSVLNTSTGEKLKKIIKS
jgi:hypothetical protein